MNKGPLKNLLNAFLDAVFPEDITCDICGKELFKKQRYPICEECQNSLPFVCGKVCEHCGMPIHNEADYCDRCQSKADMLTKNRAALRYTDEGRKMIYEIKYGGKQYLLKDFAAMMSDVYLSANYQTDVICFVPMTKVEKRVRGFNQSEVLAKELSKRLKLPVSDCLKKAKDTKAQKSLSGKERAKNLDGAFEVVGVEKINGKTVLLIDDVYTTGATMAECAKVLKRAGARSVCGLTALITEFSGIPKSKTLKNEA